MKFKNMKIAITDEVHLKAVCDVLGSMGYSQELRAGESTKSIESYSDGIYDCYMFSQDSDTTLADLLAMRDQIFMESIR